MVVLRRLAAKERARRERAFFGKERVLDFLFPGGQPNEPHLPDDLFPIVVRFYWCARSPARGADPPSTSDESESEEEEVQESESD